MSTAPRDPVAPRARRDGVSSAVAVTLIALVAALALAGARVAVDPRTFCGDAAGVVGPGAAALGLAPQTLTLAAWLGALALAGVAAWVHARARECICDTTACSLQEKPLRDADAAAPTSRIARAARLGVLAALVAGAALRVRDAVRGPWDIDEPWAYPTRASLFDDSHDALVHPPLGRALFEGWCALAGWAPGASRGLLRAPSALFGTLALALVAGLCAQRLARTVRPAWWGAAPLAAALFAALAPGAREAAALARPYALATLPVVLLVVVVLDADGRRLTPREAAAAALSAALATWADLPAGLFAALVLGARAAQDAASGRMREALSLVAGAGLPALPLVPGALRAAWLGIDPARSPIAGPIPDLRPLAQTSLLARAAPLAEALLRPLPASATLVALAFVLGVALRRGRRLPALVVSARRGRPARALGPRGPARPQRRVGPARRLRRALRARAGLAPARVVRYTRPPTRD